MKTRNNSAKIETVEFIALIGSDAYASIVGAMVEEFKPYKGNGYIPRFLKLNDGGILSFNALRLEGTINLFDIHLHKDMDTFFDFAKVNNIDFRNK